MTGQDQIIAMRKRGYAPQFVWVSDFPTAILDGMTVRIAAEDVPERLDMHFLVGLTALVEGRDADRVRRLGKVCEGFAKRVIASTFAGPRHETVTQTDTEGVCVCQ